MDWQALRRDVGTITKDLVTPLHYIGFVMNVMAQMFRHDLSSQHTERVFKKLRISHLFSHLSP